MAETSPKPPAPVDLQFESPAATQPRRVREIPSWLAAAVVLACVAGGVWFVWSTFLRTGPSERIVILDRGPNDGVTAKAGRFEVRSGDALLTVTPAGDQNVEMGFRFTKQEYLSAEERDVLTKVLRLTRDKAMASALGVTPRQVAQLEGLRTQAKIELSEADQQRLKALFLAYDAEKDPADERAAEGKLLKQLDAVAATLEAPAKQSATERTARAKSILTPDQIRRFDEIGKQ